MRVLFTVMVVVLASKIVLAGTVVQPELRLAFHGLASRPTASAVIYATHTLSDSLKATMWFQVEEGYAQAYGGMSFAPSEDMEFSLSLGLEQAERPWRAATSAWFGLGSFSSLTIVEAGGSGWWFMTLNQLEVSDSLKIGAWWYRFDGLGPRVDLKVTKWLTVSVSDLLYNPETGRLDPAAVRLGCSFSTDGE